MWQPIRGDSLARPGALSATIERLAALVRGPRRRSEGVRPDDDRPLLRASVYSALDGLAILESEVNRARRYGHPLSLALLEADLDRFQSAERPSRLTPVPTLVDLGRLLARRIRSTDALALDPGRCRLTLVLPETDLPNAYSLVQRLEAEVTRAIDVPLRWGVTHFPGCALTPEDLIRHAENVLDLGGIAGVPTATSEERHAEVASA